MMITAAVRRAANIRPDGLAIASGAERRTWREVSRRIAAMAGAVRAAGLQPGDHIATLALNSPRYFEMLLAAWWAGCVLVPINTRLSLEEVRFIIDHSGASLLVTDEAFAAMGKQAQQAVPALRGAITLDDATYEQMISQAPVEDAAPGLEALAAIFYTGGTTGLPKGVELTHANFAFAALGMERDLGHDTETVYLHAAPLFHLADFGIGLGVTLAAGGHSFLAQFSPELFYERLRLDGVTHLQLVPTMLAMLLDSPARDDRLLMQIRCVSYGAAPISQALLARLIEACPNARIQQFYGMTECCGAAVRLPPDRHVINGPKAGKLQAAGQAITGFEVRIVDPSDPVHRPCQPGEAGEIQMRGPAVMRGYWKDPEKTAQTLSDGWLCSGDIGRMDEEGFVYVVDRLKDMIISGGENIYCAEVENVLSAHPAVSTCAVIGLPDEHWGERVHAVVVVRDGHVLDAPTLDSHCRSHIAGYKVPRSYEFRSAPLPLSGVGKVQKNILRQEWLSTTQKGSQ
jgi:acyl-CoA synthetase (AMP-forming)/AMP-acid ligase II